MIKTGDLVRGDAAQIHRPHDRDTLCGQENGGPFPASASAGCFRARFLVTA